MDETLLKPPETSVGWDSVGRENRQHSIHSLLQGYVNSPICGVPGWLSSASGLGSCYDLTDCEFKPRIRLSTVSTDPASDPLSPSLSAPPLLPLSLSLSKTNIC